jgi:outer membrane protein
MKTYNSKLTFTFCLLCSLFFIKSVNGQTQKGNWLVGGSGGFSFDNQNTSNFPTNYGSSSVNSKTSTFLLNSNIGYFIKDRLVIGVNPSLHLWNSKLNYTNYPNLNNSSNSKGSSIGLGLFSRYYFLNNNEKYNFIGELSYGLDKYTDEDTYLKKTSVSIGPVIFLNKNTSLDFLLNYTNSSKNYPNNKIGNDIISFNVGFQIYL